MIRPNRRWFCSSLLALFLGAAWIAPVSAQVKLEHKYVPERKTTLHTTVNLKQVLTLAGMNLETESDRFVITSTKASKPDSEGKIRVDSATDKMTVTLKMPGGLSLQFDSDDPGKKAENPMLEPVLDLMRAASKAKTTLVFDKQGEIIAVEGLDKVAEGLSDELKGEFDAERTKKSVQQELKRLPTEAIKKGDTWSRNSDLDLGSGQAMSFTTEYTYAGEVSEGGKKFDKIDAKVTAVSFAIDPNSKLPIRSGKSDLKATESSETMLFDRGAGEWHLVKNKIRIQGDIELTINGMNFPGKLDLTIESQIQRQP